MPNARLQYNTLHAHTLSAGDEQLRRKGEQRGSVRRRGDAWHIEFKQWVSGKDGKLEYKGVSRRVGDATGEFRITKRQAEQKGYEEFVSPANGPAAGIKGTATMRQFVESYFEPDYVARRRKGGRIHYQTLLRSHILPSFGEMRLSEIGPHIVQRFISAKLQAGLATQTVKHIRNALRVIFKYAKSLHFLKGDLPTDASILPEVIHAPRRALTRDQSDMLVAAMPDRYKVLVLVMARFGLRIGEATGLRWKWVNLTDQYRIVEGEAIAPYTVAIRESFTRGEWRPILKSGNSKRTIPLTATLWVELMLHKERTPFHHDEHPVFANLAGEPLDGHNLSNRHLKPAARRIGLPWIHFHALRHTASTHMDPLMTPTEKQRILGHGSLEMGARYTHPELERVRAALDKADEGKVM